MSNKLTGKQNKGTRMKPSLRLSDWHRNEKCVSVFSLHPIDQEYSYNHIYDDVLGNNRKELHVRAANYFESIGIKDEWKEIKTIDHPKIYEFEQRLKAKDYDNAAKVMDSIDYSWTNHHKYLAHLMASGYGSDSIKQRETLLGKLSSSSLEIYNRTSLGWLYRRMGRKKEAEDHLGKAVELAINDSDYIAQIYALSELGYFLTDNAGKHDEAETILKKALQISQNIEDIYCQAHVFLGLAFADFQRQRNSSSLENTTQALALFEKVSTRLSYFRQIDCWVRLGMIYRKMGNYIAAIQTAEEGLSVANKYGLAEWKAELYSGLGFHQRAHGLFSESIKSHEEALRLFREQCGMKREEAVQHSYLANLYMEIGGFGEALKSYEKAKSIAEAVGLRRELSWILANKGILLCRLGDYEKALDIQQVSLEIVKENNHFDSQVIRFTDLAATQLAMEQFENAEISLQNAMKSAAKDLKIYLPETMPATFLEAPYLEDKLPHEMQSPDDQLRRGIILARLYLQQGRIKDASKVIQLILSYQSKPTPHLHLISLLDGLILHRSNSVERAKKSYRKAIQEAEKIQMQIPNYYPTFYTKGLAYLGIALLSTGRTRNQMKKEAIKSYQKGLEFCAANGIKNDAIRLIKELTSDQKLIKQIFSV